MSPLFADYAPASAGVKVAAEVRPLAEADLDACVALAVQREGGDAARWRAAFERDLRTGDRRTFVALVDGEVAGYATAGWFAPGAGEGGRGIPEGWYLLGLVVGPRFRRQGVGRQLTTARLAWLAGRTCRVRYFVSGANRASIDLHAGFGFRLAASAIEVPGVAFTDTGLLYEADLNNESGRRPILLELHVPTRDDFAVRRSWLLDPEMMSYNAGWQLAHPGYDRRTGCIDWPEAEWDAFEQRLALPASEQGYWYVQDTGTDGFVGHVHYQLDPPGSAQLGLNVVPGRRGTGLGSEFMRLLLERLWQGTSAEVATNEFEDDRSAAVRLHRRWGFEPDADVNDAAGRPTRIWRLYRST